MVAFFIAVGSQILYGKWTKFPITFESLGIMTLILVCTLALSVQLYSFWIEIEESKEHKEEEVIKW